MSNTNNIIKAPVNLQTDIYAVLGVGKTGSYYDVGYICGNGHGKINKWARYKPVIVANKFIIDEDDRKAANHGLTACEIPRSLLSSAASGSLRNGTLTVTIDELLAELTEWTYAPPTGGKSAPYRMSDFAKPLPLQGENGYNHYAKCFASGFSELNINEQEITDKELPMYTFNCKFDTTSYMSIGDVSGVEIPLNDLTLVTGSSITEGSSTSEGVKGWRLGIILIARSNRSWRFVGAENYITEVSTTAEIGKMMPNFNLSTNIQTWLYDNLSSITEYIGIPIFARGLQYVDEGNGTSYFQLHENGQMFSMPNPVLISSYSYKYIPIHIQSVEQSMGFTLVSATIEFLNLPTGGTYILTPNNTTPIDIAKPDVAKGYGNSCRMTMTINVTKIGNRLMNLKPGISGAFINQAGTVEKLNGSTWEAADPDTRIPIATGTYRITAIDSYTGTRTDMANLFQRFPVSDASWGYQNLPLQLQGNVETSSGTQGTQFLKQATGYVTIHMT